MDYTKVTIFTSSEGIEAVSGRLYQIGINGIEIEDFNDFSDFLENNKQYWDYVDEKLVEEKKGETKVITYIQDNAEGRDQFIQIKNTLYELKQYDKDNSFGRLDIECDKTSEEDWANNWKKYFHSMEIGEKILVTPVWEEYPKNDERIVFKINPGMTFGTGSHHTTRMCIEQAQLEVKKDSEVLDLGCGSGILSVIALLLGAKSATAVDIDPNCIKTAYENAEINNVDKNRLRVISGNIITDDTLINTVSDKKYDAVFANIVADVIMAILPTVNNLISDSGVFITSGIIEDRADEVIQEIENNKFKIVKKIQSADWFCFVCTK